MTPRILLSITVVAVSPKSLAWLVPLIVLYGCGAGSETKDPLLSQQGPNSARVAPFAATLNRLELHGQAPSAGCRAGSNSIVPFTDRSKRTGQTELVKLSTVDAFADAHGIRHITLLKIDAEGHDLAVIRGAHSMLQGHRIELVQFEYNHRWIDSRVFLLDAFEALQASGYHIGKVTRRDVEIYEEWRSELETFREGNYLGYLPSWQDRLQTIPWWDE